MTFTQIATLLNNVIVPNLFGEGESGGSAITITEDLRNVVDIGTALSDLSASDLKNYMGDLVVGVFDTYTDSRLYKDETYDLFMSEQDYGGAIQRIKCKLQDASDMHVRCDLVPPDYVASAVIHKYRVCRILNISFRIIPFFINYR